MKSKTIHCLLLSTIATSTLVLQNCKKEGSAMNKNGFKMGVHQFIHPEEDAPLDRFEKKYDGPIPGAIPPDYLQSKIKKPNRKGPASLLWDGSFCGHGEPTYGIFDLYVEGNELFEIRMTGYDENGYIVGPPFIEARPAGNVEKKWFPIYDTRKHPAATWRWAEVLRKEH
jgi:hypothetical protein